MRCPCLMSRCTPCWTMLPACIPIASRSTTSGQRPRTHRCAIRSKRLRRFCTRPGSGPVIRWPSPCRTARRLLLPSTRACVLGRSPRSIIHSLRHRRSQDSWRATGARWRSCGKSAWMRIRSMFSTLCSRWIFRTVCRCHSVCFFDCPSHARGGLAISCVAASPRRRAPGTAPRPRPRRLIRTIRCPQAMTARSSCTPRAPTVCRSPRRSPTAISGSTSTSACSGCGSCTRAPKRSSRYFPTSMPSV